MGTILFINFLEFLAFVSSIYYYKRVGGKYSLLLVWFLAVTLFVELVGWYASFVEEGQIFNSLKGTPFEENYWLYNALMLISTTFYIIFFMGQIKSKKVKIFIKIIASLFFISGLGYLIFSGVFFTSFSPYTIVVGTLLIFLSISFYYMELLNGNEILRIHKTLPFYVSVATLIFYLCTTPLFIYSTYYSRTYNPEFVKLYVQVIFGSNITMYIIYIIGFLVCAQSKKQY